MDFVSQLNLLAKEDKIHPKLVIILQKFFISYAAAIKNNGYEISQFQPIFLKYLEMIHSQLEKPFVFEPYHQAVLSPFDYYHFGLDFIRPLIIFENSKVLRLELVDRMAEQLKNRHNVILLANHQTEPDPQAISLLLEKTHPKFAEEMIFVAGHRVISDPLAVPFSMGRNLLCIFSKKHIENPPEQKQEKLAHNQKTMKRMHQLLSEGGKCIYVAPSGGRDRLTREGKVPVAQFDPQSIEMFWLISQQSEHPTHFYPMALATYALLPPPTSVEKELGERRHAQSTPIHIAFGNEINMENYPGSDNSDKRLKRKLRADYIWDLVCKDYQTLMGK